jgi:hypothetical protein
MKQSVVEENSLEKNKVFKMNVPPNIIDIVGVINDRNGEIGQMTRSLQKIDDIYARYKNQEIQVSKQNNRNTIKKPTYSPGVKFSLKKNIKDVLTGEFDVRELKKFTSSILKKNKTRNHKNNLGGHGGNLQSQDRSLEFIAHALTDRNHLNTVSLNDKTFFKTSNSKNSNDFSIYPSSLLGDFYNSSDRDLDPSLWALMHDKDYNERRSIVLSLKTKLKILKNSKKTSPSKNLSNEYSRAITYDDNEKLEKIEKLKRQKTLYKSPYFGEIEVDRIENHEEKNHVNKFNRQKTVVKSPYFGEIEVDRIVAEESVDKAREKSENLNLKNQKSIYQAFSTENININQNESRKSSFKKKISILKQKTMLKKCTLEEKDESDSDFSKSLDVSKQNDKKKVSILIDKTMTQHMYKQENEVGKADLNKSLDKTSKKINFKTQKTLLKSLVTETKEDDENGDILEKRENKLIIARSLNLSPIKMKNSIKKLSDNNNSILSEGSRKNLIDFASYISDSEEIKINFNSDQNTINSQSDSDIPIHKSFLPKIANSNFRCDSDNESVNIMEKFTKNENTEYYHISPTSKKTRSTSNNSSILKFKEELPSLYLNCKNIEKENKKISGNLSRLNIRTDKIIRNIKEKSHKKTEINQDAENLADSSGIADHAKNVFIYGKDQGHFYQNFNLLENSLSKIKDDFLHRVKNAIKSRLDIDDKKLGMIRISNKHKKVENILNSMNVIQGIAIKK